MDYLVYGLVGLSGGFTTIVGVLGYFQAKNYPRQEWQVYVQTTALLVTGLYALSELIS